MSSESPPARKPRSKPAVALPAPIDGPPPLPATLRVLDWVLIAAFLALTFLLGVFPLKDTDFWWHLRTGDWIRAHRTVPTTDLYTFTVPDHTWVDLHWGFQVALSWGYERGGVVALNLAKCVITCLALVLVLAARKRDWPVWVMLLAWLPALLVLCGRMYIRPETFTLFYLCAYLAILFRWDKHPRLAFLLPIVQVAWVNSQGLFVLGPILIGFALVASVFRPGAFALSQAKWWRTVGIATLLTGAACLINPYGFVGALYPLQLLQTMGNPVFSQSIAELTPIPLFIKRNVGWRSLPLCLHLLTILIGALSFLIPIVWSVVVRLAPERGSTAPEPEPEPPIRGTGKEGAPKSKRKSAKRANSPQEPAPAPSRDLSTTIFRFLLFATFCRLSWQATRNTHQFAAVVGTITAWNLAEWAAAVSRRRPRAESGSLGLVVLPRVATLGCIALVFVIVASGRFYAWAGEDRSIGLGEEPLWFPHEAVKFAGKEGMPGRFLSFHDGYAGLYDYYHGAKGEPTRQVFVDARLEVIGPELYERYLDLQSQIASPESQTWPAQLDQIGRPVILAGHANNAVTGANLMSSSRWRCVWFDPIVAVFVHDSNADIVRSNQVSFATQHFRPESKSTTPGTDALIASAKALWTYASVFQGKQRQDLGRPAVMLGLDHARRIQQVDRGAPIGWKLVGLLESIREPAKADKETRVPRYRFPFDPVFDLSAVRATYALRRAHLAAPDDFLTLLRLTQQYDDRFMHEATAPLLEHLIGLRPINQSQSATQDSSATLLGELRNELGAEIDTTWENLSELDRIVGAMLAKGRAGTAADLLERAYPNGTRPWEITDRIATLRLHLGEAERARELWRQASAPPKPAVRSARVAMTYLVEGAFDQARQGYREALRDDPQLFEAHYGLAVLEEDAGRAFESLRHARLAAEQATNNVARASAQEIVSETQPFAEL